jgi:hypothetical protein
MDLFILKKQVFSSFFIERISNADHTYLNSYEIDISE